MKTTGTLALNWTLEVSVAPVLVTVEVRDTSVKPVIPLMLPLKTLLASVTPAATEPFEAIVVAAR